MERHEWKDGKKKREEKCVNKSFFFFPAWRRKNHAEVVNSIFRKICIFNFSCRAAMYQVPHVYGIPHHLRALVSLHPCVGQVDRVHTLYFLFFFFFIFAQQTNGGQQCQHTKNNMHEKNADPNNGIDVPGVLKRRHRRHSHTRIQTRPICNGIQLYG